MTRLGQVSIALVALLAVNGCSASSDEGRAHDAGAVSDASADAAVGLPEASRTTRVHLFEWRWEDIARECELVLGPMGYKAVQVSPPQEHAVIPGAPWWQRYQPVSYALVSRSGNREEFADMVRRCRAVGVGVHVDVVLNHMSFLLNGVGSNGSPHMRYEYPGLYEDGDFHDCRHGIENYDDRYQVHHCQLSSLPDLATGTEHVRAQLAGYLQDLVDVGVSGLRIDAAKHMPLADIQDVLGRVDGELEVFQEVIDLGGGAVSSSEYTPTGGITEFRYSTEIARVFRRGQLSWLEEFGEAWGFLPSDKALVFVDNHDNQRGHGFPTDAISFKDGALHDIANVFVLAWPYGHARVMSSYEFDDGDQGPPGSGGVTGAALDASGNCNAGWVCEHRKQSRVGMVHFRNLTKDAREIRNWWSNDNDQIAFSRGNLGFVAINREELPAGPRTYQTGLPEGAYCDLTTGFRSGDDCEGRTVHVDADGWAELDLGGLDAIAIAVEPEL